VDDDWGGPLDQADFAGSGVKIFGTVAVGLQSTLFRGILTPSLMGIPWPWVDENEIGEQVWMGLEIESVDALFRGILTLSLMGIPWPWDDENGIGEQDGAGD
jgi:hypothetical protein